MNNQIIENYLDSISYLPISEFIERGVCYINTFTEPSKRNKSNALVVLLEYHERRKVASL